jgi:hypothetical protein
MGVRTLNKISSLMKKDGYRNGKVNKENETIQDSFNRGYSKGYQLGLLCGKLIATCKMIVKESSNDSDCNQKKRILNELEEIFFEKFVDINYVAILDFDHIQSLVTILSESLVPEVEAIRIVYHAFES